VTLAAVVGGGKAASSGLIRTSAALAAWPLKASASKQQPITIDFMTNAPFSPSAGVHEYSLFRGSGKIPTGGLCCLPANRENRYSAKWASAGAPIGGCGMFSRLLGLLVVVAAVLISAQTAFAERRVALIIGNSIYKNVVQLPNPARDAASVADMFKKAGFDVVESKLNLNNTDMRRAIREFTATARNADIAVVYYAGHGIEFDGVNYLIPVDAQLATDVDVEDETVSLDRIIRMLDPVKRLRLVMLDACRENPFARKMTRTVATRSVGRGLAQVEVTGTDTLWPSPPRLA
jgi:hypothetical protein